MEGAMRADILDPNKKIRLSVDNVKIQIQLSDHTI